MITCLIYKVNNLFNFIMQHVISRTHTLLFLINLNKGFSLVKINRFVFKIVFINN